MKRWLVITMWLLIAFAGFHYSQPALAKPARVD